MNLKPHFKERWHLKQAEVCMCRNMSDKSFFVLNSLANFPLAGHNSLYFTLKKALTDKHNAPSDQPYLQSYVGATGPHLHRDTLKMSRSQQTHICSFILCGEKAF